MERNTRQRTAIHHNALPRTRTDATTMMMPHGMTVTSIHNI